MPEQEVGKQEQRGQFQRQKYETNLLQGTCKARKECKLTAFRRLGAQKLLTVEKIYMTIFVKGAQLPDENACEGKLKYE